MTVNESFLAMDEITGLFTKASFEYLLTRKIALAEECGEYVGLLMIDPDDSGLIPQMEEKFAEFFLREMAGRLKGCLRAGDIVAHCDPGQFAVIVDEVENPNITPLVGRKIIQALSATYPFGETGTELRCSVGIVCQLPHESGEAELIAKARKALINAKAEGGNQLYFYIDAVDGLTGR